MDAQPLFSARRDKISINKNASRLGGVFVGRPPGIEPGPKGPQPFVLPLHHGRHDFASEYYQVSCSLATRRTLVPRDGIEPSTLGLEVPCSIQLSYRGTSVPRNFLHGAFLHFFGFSASIGHVFVDISSFLSHTCARSFHGPWWYRDDRPVGRNVPIEVIIVLRSQKRPPDRRVSQPDEESRVHRDGGAPSRGGP